MKRLAQWWSVLIWLAAIVPGLFQTPAGAAAYTNVTAVNVTPTAFQVLWGAPPETDLFLRVDADALGATNLNGQVAIEYLPLRAGSPLAAEDTPQRLSRQALQQKVRDYGLASARVSGCRPGTTYHVRAAIIRNGATNYLPPLSEAPVPVRTADEVTLVPEALQLLLEVPGQTVEGRLVVLTHPQAAYPLAAVVGDGAPSNHVVFSLAELLEAAGRSNFTATGSQVFLAQVLGAGVEGGVTQSFPVEFTGAFSVARSYLASFSSELASLALGSLVIQAGQTGSVPVLSFATVGVDQWTADLEIEDNHLTHLALLPVAPEVDPAQLELTKTAAHTWRMRVASRAGQVFFGEQELCRLQFVPLTNVPSAFVTLRVLAVNARKPGASLVPGVLSQNGRVVVIGREPLLEPRRAAGPYRELTVYGNPWASFLIEGTAALGSGQWQVLARFPSTNLISVVAVPADPAVRFYRAAEFQANPPILALSRSPTGLSPLLVFGQTSSNYVLQYKPSLSPEVPWQTMATLTLTNSFGYVGGLVPTNAAGFFRLVKP
ncbi:hypothetical protein NXS98_07090 [Fontisphaera persica]|uniref:hypothetical protein n=1 Tax=Fontisphaera persica TaxID=2974023 RepID=UPI0024BF202E|nr:hypothetical protein [Fontisphaera persica]WCJ60884.1 hypothetical protein NXS98_07090 [Fontisphaera persica]